MKTEIIWEGRPSLRTGLKYFLLCGALFWLVVPLWLAWRRYRIIRSTRYRIDERFAHIRNDDYRKFNRVLELYRIHNIRLERSDSKNALICNIVFTPKQSYAPEIRFEGIELSDEEFDRIQQRIAAIHEEKRIGDITIPILQ